jgi:hypothetical protein
MLQTKKAKAIQIKITAVLFVQFIQPVMPPLRRTELSPTICARMGELRYTG